MHEYSAWKTETYRGKVTGSYPACSYVHIYLAFSSASLKRSPRSVYTPYNRIVAIYIHVLYRGVCANVVFPPFITFLAILPRQHFTPVNRTSREAMRAWITLTPTLILLGKSRCCCEWSRLVRYCSHELPYVTGTDDSSWSFFSGKMYAA